MMGKDIADWDFDIEITGHGEQFWMWGIILPSGLFCSGAQHVFLL